MRIMMRLFVILVLVTSINQAWAFKCVGDGLDVPVQECIMLNTMYSSMNVAASILSQSIKDAWGGQPVSSFVTTQGIVSHTLPS